MSGSRATTATSRGRAMVRRPAITRPAAKDGVWRRAWFHPAATGSGAADRADAPSILTFTSDTFVEDFLGALATADGAWPATWPALVPFRDWAEPPKDTCDAGGDPRYPATIDRRTPLTGEVKGPDGTSTLPDDRTDVAFVDTDGPTWLRKLYLPLHLHFHLVVGQLACDRYKSPPIDPARIVEAGLVVRRLVASTAARDDGWTGERWEDWIPSPAGGGVWVELSGVDARMARRGTPLDPSALPADLTFSGVSADEVAARVASGGAAYTLGSAKMTRVPPTMGQGGAYSAYFGVLPAASADLERPPVDADSIATARAAAKATALAAVADATTSPAAQARQLALQAAWDELVDVALGTAPSTNAVSTAKSALSTAEKTTASDLAQVLGALAVTSIGPDPTTSPTPHADADAWWTAAATALGLTPASSGGIVMHGTLAGATLTAHQDLQLRGIVLARVRRARTELQYELDQLVSGDVARDLSFEDEADTLYKTVTVGALAAGIDAVRSAEANRGASVGGMPAPEPGWPDFDPSTLPAHFVALHDGLVAVEREIEALSAVVNGGGVGVTAAIDARADSAVTALTTVFGADPRTFGVDPTISTERGVLAWPTPDASSAAALSTEVSAWYDAAANETALETDRADRRRLVRPRFDHRSLYAVWTWARVKDTDPCAADQIVWSRRSEVYALAEPTDVLGAKPVAFSLPDIPKLLRDVPRIPLAGANPFAAVTLPSGSNVSTGEDMMDTAQKWGIAWICSFGIPVFTICAWILFSIIFGILILIGFSWMLLLKFCIPVPAPKS